MNIIEIENLSHEFPDKTLALENITLSIKEGELIALAGPNGSGKTTLLKHLNALLLPSSGEVRLNGRPIQKNIKEARLKVGMVFQDMDSQIVGETVISDVMFGPENLGLESDEIKRRTEKALEITGLIKLAHHRPHTLSGGEKRRLCIAGVLAMEPEVVLFDEPFSNLDFLGTKEVLTQILSLHEKGRTVIVATHDLEKIIAHADRLLIMNKGRIMRDDTPKKLLSELESFGVREPCASRLGTGIISWLE